VDLRTVWRPEQRRDVVARLREKRWSTTRIAEAIGVDEKTVRNDLSGSENSEPESPVTGQDGKSYPSSLPAPAQIAERRDRAQELPVSGTVPETEALVQELRQRDLSNSANAEIENPSRVVRGPGTAASSARTFQDRGISNLKAASSASPGQELRTGSADGALAVLQSPTSSPGRPWFANPRPSNSVGRLPDGKLEKPSSSGQQRFSPYFIGVCGLFFGLMIAKYSFGDHAFDRLPSAVVNSARLYFLLV